MAIANGSTNNNLLSVPANAGRVIVEKALLLACPLLGTDRFISFCSKRGLKIDRQRLLRLERLGLFAPLFRVRDPDDSNCPIFRIPVQKNANWFEMGWAWDATSISEDHLIPQDGDATQEAYFSVFQIDLLRVVLVSMTMHVHLDAYAESSSNTRQKDGESSKRWSEYAAQLVEGARGGAFRPALALLCQYISNRYYFKTQGDRRTIQVGVGTSSDRWISVSGYDWNWETYAQSWNPKEVEKFFDLNEEKLKHAYKALAVAQSSIDPLENWYSLIPFVSINERKRLKNEALQAETLREGAWMLRWLYQDLYSQELPEPNEVARTVITHQPELGVRQDPRQHLEYVVNRFGLNPQPKLVLFVEGQTEVRVVQKLFDDLFEFTPGTCHIEVLALKGVGNATGNKQDDRFQAILRLVDYLHHHQTMVYLLLDNENRASRLKQAVSKASSIHGNRQMITRPEYIQIWKKSFEFDNFSDTEIAAGLTAASTSKFQFTRSEVRGCRNSKFPGAELGKLFKTKTTRDIGKHQLTDRLLDLMLAPGCRREVTNRPVVKMLNRVVNLAIRNPFPTTHETWTKNQTSKILAKKS